MLYLASIVLQIAEGYGWLLLGEVNCGTQIKFSSLLTSSLFLLIIYTVLNKSQININNKFLRSLGDYSFGIYLSHVMVMIILREVPYYSALPYLLNTTVVLLISWAFCYIANKICGKKLSGWLGLK